MRHFTKLETVELRQQEFDKYINFIRQNVGAVCFELGDKLVTLTCRFPPEENDWEVSRPAQANESQLRVLNSALAIAHNDTNVRDFLLKVIDNVTSAEASWVRQLYRQAELNDTFERAWGIMLREDEKPDAMEQNRIEATERLLRLIEITDSDQSEAEGTIPGYVTDMQRWFISSGEWLFQRLSIEPSVYKNLMCNVNQMGTVESRLGKQPDMNSYVDDLGITWDTFNNLDWAKVQEHE